MSEPHSQSDVSEPSVSDVPKQSLADSTPFILPLDTPPGVPAFKPARGLSSGHLQTMWSVFRPATARIVGTVQRKLRFADGDFAVLHDDKPETWARGDHVALLMHGLSGSHNSGYMTRIAAKLVERNVRVFRMDHRGCGAGRMMARHPYHAGRIRDLEAAIRMLERLCPGSPVSVAGFSLSGNLVLRYLGENSDSLPMSLFRAVAVCPPIDLQHCVEKLDESTMGRRYNWYFARELVSQLSGTPQWREDLPLAKVKRLPRTLVEFDELYTAPASGYASAKHYYADASAKPHIGNIRVHTSVLVAEDDPMVSSEPWNDVNIPPNITLCMTKRGGHLGFVSRRGHDLDNRWMDWRVVDWLLH